MHHCYNRPSGEHRYYHHQMKALPFYPVMLPWNLVSQKAVLASVLMCEHIATSTSTPNCSKRVLYICARPASLKTGATLAKAML